MENNIKNIYEILCNWYAYSQDASGNKNNSWKGNIVLFADNSCLGYATDEGHKSPTHLLAGTFVEGKGLSICKIHSTNLDYDPIFFDAFFNEKGDKNTYYGQFSAKTFFDFVPMGITLLNFEQKEKSENIADEITSIYNNMKTSIQKRVDNPALTLDMVEKEDSLEVSRKLELIAEELKLEDLPKELSSKVGTQPASN